MDVYFKFEIFLHNINKSLIRCRRRRRYFFLACIEFCNNEKKTNEAKHLMH